PHAELEVDSALAKRPFELLADRLILVGHKVGEGLDDGDLSAPRAPHAREFHADDAAAEHGHLRGNEVELERALRRDDTAADLQTGEAARVRAGGQNHVLARDTVTRHLHRRGGDELSLALDRRDAASLDEALQ